MEIDKIRTTAYGAATNGVVRRFHRTLNAILGKIISENQRDWCEKVPIAAAAYRASVHEATGYTPNRLMLGRETRAPLDIVVGCPPEEQQSYESTDQFVAERQQRMREVYSVVREHLQRVVGRRKKNYNVRVKPAQFKEGDWVWYYYPRRYTQKSPKWQSLYTGPFKVTRILPPSNAVIRRSKRTQPFVVHFEKLKKCYQVPPTSEKQAPVVVGPDDRDGPVRQPAAMSQNLSSTHDVQDERTGSSSNRRPRRFTRSLQHLRDYVYSRKFISERRPANRHQRFLSFNEACFCDYAISGRKFVPVRDSCSGALFSRLVTRRLYVGCQKQRVTCIFFWVTKFFFYEFGV